MNALEPDLPKMHTEQVQRLAEPIRPAGTWPAQARKRARRDDSPDPERGPLAQRKRMQLARRASRTLREAYPRLARLDVQLTFQDGSPASPSGQRHTLHPPAPAFLRFPCPFASCSGEIDLQAALEAALARGQRECLIHYTCSGSRGHGRIIQAPCSLQIHCTLTLHYEAGASLR